MQTAHADLDRFDQAILRILSTEGRIAVTELARRIGLSKSPTQTRLKRLEDEQSEFQEFLDRLRFAKDKTEFDQFMAERKDRPANEEPKGEQRPE